MLREERSTSQILFNMLPEQTADLGGRIWKVNRWRDPLPLAVDDQNLRRRLIAALAPWSMSNPRRDSFAADQLLGHHSLEVVELNKDRGVGVDAWPQVFVCQQCRRIEQSSSHNCRCGVKRWSQLHFVGFHECGYLTEPWIPKCPQHNEVAINSPRTAQAKDLRFTCPTCQREMLRGLGAGRPCRGCNQPGISYTVHRAASVYTSHGFTMVNPARPDQLRELQGAGGPARCLDWVVGGMEGAKPQAAPPSQETLLANLLAAGLGEDAARAAVAAAAGAGHQFANGDDAGPRLPPDMLESAQDDALDLAVGVYNGRTSATDLAAEVRHEDLVEKFSVHYPAALSRAGLADADLIDRFPVLRGVFGYSRESNKPTSRLVMFRGRGGAFRVYADSSETEALLIRLDPIRVSRWLHNRGLINSVPNTAQAARMQILANADIPGRGDEPATETVGSALLTLLHSYSHRLIRSAAVYAGIDRDALAEYLVPRHLCAFIYAGSRGDFVLGGLQAMFEHDLDDLLTTHVESDSRCPLDPGCQRGPGACPACLHLGEPSCGYYNQFLSRPHLFGEAGYLTMEH